MEESKSNILAHEPPRANYGLKIKVKSYVSSWGLVLTKIFDLFLRAFKIGQILLELIFPSKAPNFLNHCKNGLRIPGHRKHTLRFLECMNTLRYSGFFRSSKTPMRVIFAKIQIARLLF